MNQEPWVSLPNNQALSDWGHAHQVAYNQQARQSEKLRFYQQAFDYLTENGIQGAYLEFGCHRARTFRMALTEARRQNRDDMRFYAYDSFQGLPEPESDPGIPGWTKGALRTTEAEFTALINDDGIYVDRVTTVPGFYSETLKANDTPRPKAAFVTVDCDLYESTRDVLAFVSPLLVPGAVVYMDDYHVGPGAREARW